MTARTKSILTFLGGLVTGVVLTFVFLIFLGLAQAYSGSTNKDLTLFDGPGQELRATEFKVFQVLPDGAALANIADGENRWTTVLFLPDEGVAYYDDQRIHVPAGKRAMQIGTYRYVTPRDFVKTVPVVEIVDR